LTLPDPPVLVITDRRMAEAPLADVLEAVLAAGCRWILVREPDLGGAALASVTHDANRLCAPHDARLSISADLDAAATARAGGIHLPQRLADRETVAMARTQLDDGALVGISTHSPEEAREAQELGADYVTLSPIFLTASKPGYGPAIGLDALRTQTAALTIPIVALAGIEPGNAAQVRGAGAAGIAVMGSVMRARNPGAVMTTLLAAWQS
jgi:thiamine-phosphate pyrophosphorylase